MYHQPLSDTAIIDGFRHGNAAIIRRYFYEYCRVGYQLFDKRYQLSQKENLDFMSLAHQYALYLMEHDWKPLEDHSAGVSLRTWLINGFRYIVLDALKWHRREYGTLTFDDYLRSFDVTQDLRLQFNKVVNDLCDHANLTRQERYLIEMLLLQGYKANEVAAMMGITPAAVSQKYKSLKERIIVPYFRKYFDMDFDTAEVMDVTATSYDRGVEESIPTVGRISLEKMAMEMSMNMADDYQDNYMAMEQQTIRPMDACRARTTPDFITSLSPGEIFVFGSNLKGMHGGGAAWTAYRKFGAVMGQGVGLQGQSYAIPTMQGGPETIRPYVDEFIAFAKAHPELTFLVTRIGCGIAGFSDSEIAPLFVHAHSVDNIVLPKGW